MTKKQLIAAVYPEELNLPVHSLLQPLHTKTIVKLDLRSSDLNIPYKKHLQSSLQPRGRGSAHVTG